MVIILLKKPEYSVVQVKNKKLKENIVAIYDRKGEKILKRQYKVVLGSPIKESTMIKKYHRVLGLIADQKAPIAYRFINNMGRLN